MEEYKAYAKKHGLTGIPNGDAMFPMPGTENDNNQTQSESPYEEQ